MTRAQRFIVISSALMMLHFWVFFGFFSTPFIAKDVSEKILPAIPWWLLVSFGSYGLGSIGWDLWTFRDCPEAFTDLMAEISRAKDELRSRGVTVD